MTRPPIPPLLRQSRAQWFVFLLALTSVGCQSIQRTFQKVASSDSVQELRGPEEVPAALAEAQRLFADGNSDKALRLLRVTRETRGVSPELRDQVERTTESVAQVRLQELIEAKDAEGLGELFGMELPRQITVTAGVRSAAALLEEGDPRKAVKRVVEVDQRTPFHHERAQAGDVVFEAGSKMIADDPAVLDFLTLRDNGRDALTYFCNTYVSHPRWDEACYRIAESYEEEKLWRRAQDWHEDLLYLRPESWLAPYSRASIPSLRLSALASPQYDRAALLLAKDELERWNELYPNHEWSDEVRLDYVDCLTRLMQSDISIARFYGRNAKFVGARLHADRVAQWALQLEDPKLTQEAQALAAEIDTQEKEHLRREALKAEVGREKKKAKAKL